MRKISERRPAFARTIEPNRLDCALSEETLTTVQAIWDHVAGWCGVIAEIDGTKGAGPKPRADPRRDCAGPQALHRWSTERRASRRAAPIQEALVLTRPWRTGEPVLRHLNSTELATASEKFQVLV